MADAGPRPKLTPGRAALLGLMARYLEPGGTATLLEVQKLLYFLQEAGEPLRLRFEKQMYGPYADAVRHVLRTIEGHYLTGYGDGTRAGGVALMPGSSDAADACLENVPVTKARFDRVMRLVADFEGPYGLELLATAHWVAQREGAESEMAVVEAVQAWSQRKGRLFTADHIAIARERLLEEGWLAPARSAGS
jgi:hypothetical protein